MMQEALDKNKIIMDRFYCYGNNHHMSTLAERFTFITNKDGSVTKIRLHAVSSESQYPHPHYLGFEFPFDASNRLEDIETIHTLLRQIGLSKTDILMIEKTYGVSMHFQSASDLMHFRIANEIDDADLTHSNVEFGLEFKDKETQSKGKLRRARNDFEKARKRALIPKDHCRISINNRDGTIDVRTETISEYLAIYKNLSNRTKERFALIC